MSRLPPTPVPCLRIDLAWAVEGDANALTRLFWQYTGGPPNGSNLFALAGNVNSAVVAHFEALMGSWVSLSQVTLTRLDGDGGPQASTPGTAVGTRTGTQLPPASSALVNYQIPRLYRGGKPRSYFPFGASGDVDTTGLWKTTFTDAVDTAYGAFEAEMAGFGTGTVNLTQQANVSYYDGFEVIISPTTGRARNMSKKRTTPQVDTIDNWVTSLKIGSQRRRNRNA